MDLLEKSAFYEKLCSLGYAVYEGDHGRTFVQKASTFVDATEKFAGSFATREDAIAAIQEEIGWKWEGKQPESEVAKSFKFEVYAEFHDGYGQNHAELGIIDAKDQPDLDIKATRAAEIYFRKIYPDKPLEEIKARIRWRPYINAE